MSQRWHGKKDKRVQQQEREKWQQGRDPQQLTSITMFFNSKIAQAVIALTKGKSTCKDRSTSINRWISNGGGKNEQKLLGIDGGEKRLEYLRKEENEANGVILERMVKWYPD